MVIYYARTNYDQLPFFQHILGNDYNLLDI